MKRSFIAIVLAFVAVCLFDTGCRSTQSESLDAKTATSTDSISSKPIPPDSPFAKIKKGMSMAEVIDLIGPHTDMATYTTGKQWIPYYLGRDIVRTIAFYKGMGRIYYALGGGTLLVIAIEYDPDEPGYASRRQ